MRHIQIDSPKLPHMRYIVKIDPNNGSRVFAVNTASTAESNVVYLIPPKRAAAMAKMKPSTTGKVIDLSEHF